MQIGDMFDADGPVQAISGKTATVFQMAEKGKVANKRIETVHPDLNFRTAGQQLLVYEVPGFTVDGRRGL